MGTDILYYVMYFLVGTSFTVVMAKVMGDSGYDDDYYIREDKQGNVYKWNGVKWKLNPTADFGEECQYCEDTFKNMVFLIIAIAVATLFISLWGEK